MQEQSCVCVCCFDTLAHAKEQVVSHAQQTANLSSRQQALAISSLWRQGLG